MRLTGSKAPEGRGPKGYRGTMEEFVMKDRIFGDIPTAIFSQYSAQSCCLLSIEGNMNKVVGPLIGFGVILGTFFGCGGGSTSSGSPGTGAPPTVTFAFISGHCCSFDLKLLKSDGTSSTLATDYFYTAVLSHNTKKVAFSFQDSNGLSQVGTINSDGSGRETLTEGVSPQFSPDDSKILYDANPFDPTDDLHLMNVDGSGDVSLTSAYSGVHFCQATFSPDGTMIAAAIQASPFLGIVTMNSNGSGMTQVYSGASTYTVAFTPDGSHLIFDLAGSLWSSDLAGGNAKQLTSGIFSFAPVLVGSSIYFTGATNEGQSQNIYSMNPDGTNQRVLSREPVFGGSMIGDGCRF